jgi:hypothetical protein
MYKEWISNLGKSGDYPNTLSMIDIIKENKTRAEAKLELLKKLDRYHVSITEKDREFSKEYNIPLAYLNKLDSSISNLVDLIDYSDFAIDTLNEHFNKKF